MLKLEPLFSLTMDSDLPKELQVIYLLSPALDSVTGAKLVSKY